MNAAILEQKEAYREVNAITGSAGSVIFGTQSFSGLPVAELVQDFGLNISVCNRSVEEATLDDAFDLLDECVYELHPHKVFLNFGETDMTRPDFDQERFIAEYEQLIQKTHEGGKRSVYIIPVLSAKPEAEKLNAALRALAERTGSCYVDVADIFQFEKPRVRLFSELTHYMREGRMSFSEAMHVYGF